MYSSLGFFFPSVPFCCPIPLNYSPLLGPFLSLIPPPSSSPLLCSPSFPLPRSLPFICPPAPCCRQDDLKREGEAGSSTTTTKKKKKAFTMARRFVTVDVVIWRNLFSSSPLFFFISPTRLLYAFLFFSDSC